MISKPFYCDLHIHSLPNANNKETAYDGGELFNRVSTMAAGHVSLISLTDHNTINEAAYKQMTSYADNGLLVLLGVELTIRPASGKTYHAHAYFDADPTDSNVISKINDILDKLYPEKLPGKDDSIPDLPEILNSLRKYSFLLLPHGGQSHKTFDNALQEGDLFNDLMLRTIYYNTFDGYTARSYSGLEKTQEYFKAIGIDQFTNLLTGSDNYDPKRYPAPKAENAEPFTPTWVYSEPTFSGLRLALSEGTRLKYAEEAPDDYLLASPSISHIELHEDNIDINVDLSVGLNVIIGSSSTGKTLLAETIARRTGALDETGYHTFYDRFGIERAVIKRNDQTVPYYINQNYISKVVDKEVNDQTIDSIQILKNIFPRDAEASRELDESFANVKDLLKDLCRAAESAQSAMDALSHLRNPELLITEGEIANNPISTMIPDSSAQTTMSWDSIKERKLFGALSDIEEYFNRNPLLDSVKREADTLKKSVQEGKRITDFHVEILAIIQDYERQFNALQTATKESDKQKEEDFKAVLKQVSVLVEALMKFDVSLKKLRGVHFETKEKSKRLRGHKLEIVHSFNMSDDLLLKAINHFYLSNYQLSSIDDLTIETLNKMRINGQYRIQSLNKFAEKITSQLEEQKTYECKITTKSGKDWNSLSEGRKTAVLLDLILGFSGDTAPLIIDQPEDNLASDYINEGLATAIKDGKGIRQTLIVTHNATIPILGDAQTVVLCRQDENGKIIIRSAPLEGEINGKRMLDWIAEITDGGKSSIQKRVKKYNFKTYKETR